MKKTIKKYQDHRKVGSKIDYSTEIEIIKPLISYFTEGMNNCTVRVFQEI